MSAEDLLPDRGWLLRLARDIAGTDAEAEDVAQDSALAALRRMSRGGASLPRTWFRRVVQNLVRERVRKSAHRRAREEVAARAEALPAPEELLSRMEMQRIVAEEVVGLSEPYRSMVILRYTDDLLPSEIARRLGIPAGTVRSRLSHGLEELRERLDRRFGDRKTWTAGFVALFGGRLRGGAARTGAPGAGVGGKLLTAALVISVALVSLFLALRARAPEPDALAAVVPRDAVERVPVEVASSPDRDGGTRRERASAFDVAWIEGIVERSGCAVGEPLAVVVLDEPASWATLVRTHDLSALERHEVDAEGRFRVPAELGRRVHLALLGEVSFIARTVAVVAGTGTEPVRLRAEPGARVSGVLLGPDGAPVRSADLQLAVAREAVSDEMLVTNDLWIAWARTDAAGAFAFPPASAERALVLFALPASASLASGGFLTLPEQESCGESILESTLLPAEAIAGRVVDTNGAPLAGARVACRLPGGWAPAPPLLSETVSGADGSFVLAGVSPGRVLVRAEKSGCLPGRDVAVLPRVGGASARDDLRLELVPGTSAVRGRVLDPSGAPVEGARVELFADQLVGEQERDAPTRATHSGEDGGFAFEPATGAFRVQARGALAAAAGEALHSSRSGAASARVEAGGPDVELVLARECSFAGRVRSAIDGSPVPGFELVLGRADPDAVQLVEVVRRRFFDAHGAFEVSDLAPGRWTVRARADGWLSPEPTFVDLPLAGEVVLEVLPAASLAGVVVEGDGTPIEGAFLLLAAEGSTLTWQDVTLADGSFAIAEVPPGRYLLRIVDPRGLRPGRELSFELSAGEVRRDLRFELAAGAILAGRVLGRAEAPLAGARVSLRQVQGGRRLEATTDADGAFRFDELAAGLWTVSVPFHDGRAEPTGDEGDRAAFAPHGAPRAWQTTRAVAIEPGETAEFVFRSHEDELPLVRGSVRRGGEPLRGRLLSFFSSGAGDPISIVSVTTDGEGRFELRLRPDVYLVRVLSVEDPEELVFAVAVTDEPEQFLALQGPLGAISGRVLSNGGAPAAGVRIELTCDATPERESIRPRRELEAITDAEGRFSFRGLWPGSYRLFTGGDCSWCPPGSTPAARRVFEPLVLGVDEVIEGLELSVRAPAGGLEVVARDDEGRPVAGAALFLRNALGELLDPLARVLTDGEGRAHIGSLSEGRYSLTARSVGLASPRIELVAVVPGNVSALELVLAPATILVVSCEDGRARPVPASIAVFDSSGRRWDGLASPSEARSRLVLGGDSPTGAIVGPLPPGLYSLHCRPAAGGSATTTTLELTGEPERRITLRLGE